ncbi:MAG: transposase [Luteolibacter sp.]
METAPKFWNPDEEISRHGAKLPHWQQDHSTFFLTFRLADSIPQAKLEKWKAERAIWLQVHPEPWSEAEESEYNLRFSNLIERWLDGGEGECLLGQKDAAHALSDVLLAKNGERYTQHSFVIMPNHLHVLASIGTGETLEGLVKIWKGTSSRKMNTALDRSGEFWQANYYDRMIRDSEHFWNCARYIRKNPIKARLLDGEYFLHESDYVRDALETLR